MAAIPHHHSHYANFVFDSRQNYLHPTGPVIVRGQSVWYVRGVYRNMVPIRRYFVPRDEQRAEVNFYNRFIVPVDESWILSAREREEGPRQRGSIHEQGTLDDSLILNGQPIEDLHHLDLTDREAMFHNTAHDSLSEEIISEHLNSRNHNLPINAGDICVVCQDCLFERDTVATLDCGHGFHAGCIKRWLMVKNCCPLCKATGIRL